MVNRIRHIFVRNRSLMPTQAEVWITVEPEQQTPATEVRGRLMGPRCPYAHTVEVAYALRPLPPREKADGPTMRVVIPEASLWEPQCPFLYRGPIELWQDGRCCEQIVLSHGLRSLQVTQRGLFVNGRPLTLSGRLVTACSDQEAQALREEGCNLLIVPLETDTLPVWERADRLGFFVLGRLLDDSDETLRHLPMLSRRPSCLGWLVEKEKHPPLDWFPAGVLLGLIGAEGSPEPPSEAVHFLLGPAELANLGKPLLVTAEEPSHLEGCTLLGSVL